jgi:hypothetical protein
VDLDVDLDVDVDLDLDLGQQSGYDRGCLRSAVARESL